MSELQDATRKAEVNEIRGAIQRTRQDALMVTVEGRRGSVIDPGDLVTLLLAAEAYVRLTQREAAS